jgi:branched-chain amino acid transport system ATP-binding protein
MIEIEDLTVMFGGVRGLNGLTATLTEPVTGLVGPNGAGKTTLINVLSGFVPPFSGSVRIDGQDLRRIPVHKRAAFGVRRTFQNEQVVENLSVEDNVMAVLEPPASKPVQRVENNRLLKEVKGLLVPQGGFEPPTPSLRMTCSTS